MGTATVEVLRVSKHKPPPDSSPRRVTVKINAEIHRKARIVAGIRGIDIADLLDDLLAGLVHKEYMAARKQLETEGE